ncbi:MAG: hypothetical protein QXK08_03175 [Candidatus Woesearchaeota archaeon]
MAEAMAFLVMPPIIAGLIIGIYEYTLLRHDVSAFPIHRFSHAIAALIYAVVACFCTFNAEWVLATFTFLQSIPYITPLTFQILVALITVLKVHGVSYAIPGSRVGMGMGMRGMSETWIHSLVIGALTVIAPYVWPLLAPALPDWMQ